MSEREFITKASGAKLDFGTGSVRDGSVGKGRFDLIPPIALRRLAGLYERGIAVYGARNWEKGQKLCESFVDSAMSHLVQLMGGEPTEDHAAAVLWNIAGYMWTLNEIEAGRLPASLDDRPPPEPQYAAPTPKTNADAEAEIVGRWLSEGK